MQEVCNLNTIQSAFYSFSIKRLKVKVEYETGDDAIQQCWLYFPLTI